MLHAPRFRFILLVLSISAAHAAEVVNLTLEQALASVEKTNLTVLLSREAVVQTLE